MLKFILTTLCICLLSANIFASGNRIAVVNLEKIFREYYKSKIAEDVIKQQAEVYRQYLLRQNNMLKNLLSEQRVAENNSLNLGMDETERKKYQEQAKSKAREIRETQARIELYSSEKSSVMRELERKKRAEIVTEIITEIDRRAVSEGYDFVFDISGRTLNEQPTVLRYPKGCDITKSIIDELNRTKVAIKNNTNKPIKNLEK